MSSREIEIAESLRNMQRDYRDKVNALNKERHRLILSGKVAEWGVMNKSVRITSEGDFKVGLEGTFTTRQLDEIIALIEGY